MIARARFPAATGERAYTHFPDVHAGLSEPTDGVVEDTVRIEPLTKTDLAPAVQLAVRVLRVRPGDRGEQFALDITDDRRQMFVAKANGQVVAYGRATELAADEAGPETPAGYYLSGVLVEPALRRRGIALALTQARLRWVFARTDEVFYVAGAGNVASLRLHMALGFQEVKRFGSERSAAGVDVLSRLARTGPAVTSARSPTTGDPSSWPHLLPPMTHRL